MRLLLVRHGQTPSNVRRVLDTASPGPGLTDVGEEQAEALVNALGDEDITVVMASTLTRTQLTAAPLAAARGLTVRVRPGIREIPAGALEGLGGEAETTVYRDVMFGWVDGDLTRTMPGDDRDGAQMLAEFDAVVHEAQEAAGAGTVLLVSHGGAIRTWVGARGANLAQDYAREHPLANTGVIVLSGSTAAGWTVEEWDADPVGLVMTADENDPAGGVE